MKRILFLFTMIFIGSVLNANEFESGVWVGKDCELVRTKNYCIFFGRQGENVFSKCYAFEKNDKQIECSFIGEIEFSDTSVINKQFLYLEDSIISQDLIGQKTSNGLIVRVNETTITLRKIENIEIVKPYEMFYANSKNVGECIHQWQLGTQFWSSKEKKTVKLTIETNKHSYVFSANTNSIYCRAARIRSNNHGTLFAQYVRMWNDQNDHTCYMKNNLDSVSSVDLLINNELFEPEKCIRDDSGIYWTLVDFKKKRLKLTGCSSTYTYNRISPSSGRLKEWINYEKY